LSFEYQKSAEFEAAFAEVKKIRRIRFFKAGFAKASAESALHSSFEVHCFD